MPASKTPRTAPIDAAIDEINQQIAEATQQRARLVRDAGGSPDEIAQLNTHLQALRHKLAGQEELRAEAKRFDEAERLVAERERHETLASEAVTILRGRRAAAGRKLDQLCASLGEALAEIEACNREAWSRIVDVRDHLQVSDAHCGPLKTRTGEGAAGMNAFIAALKKAGVGRVGIQAEVLWPLTTYTSIFQASTVEEEMNATADRVEALLQQHLNAARQRAADVLERQ